MSGHCPGSPLIARLIVAVETSMARSSSNAWQCSSRVVRSGLLWSCSGSHAASGAPLCAGGPATPFLGSKAPVSLLSLSQRLMEGIRRPRKSLRAPLGAPQGPRPQPPAISDLWSTVSYQEYRGGSSITQAAVSGRSWRYWIGFVQDVGYEFPTCLTLVRSSVVCNR